MCVIVVAEIVLSREDYVSKKALNDLDVSVIVLSYMNILLYFKIVMFQLKSFWNLSHIQSIK